VVLNISCSLHVSSFVFWKIWVEDCRNLIVKQMFFCLFLFLFHFQVCNLGTIFFDLCPDKDRASLATRLYITKQEEPQSASWMCALCTVHTSNALKVVLPVQVAKSTLKCWKTTSWNSWIKTDYNIFSHLTHFT